MMIININGVLLPPDPLIAAQSAPYSLDIVGGAGTKDLWEGLSGSSWREQA